VPRTCSIAEPVISAVPRSNCSTALADGRLSAARFADEREACVRRES
jgi:hypothetical protein